MRELVLLESRARSRSRSPDLSSVFSLGLHVCVLALAVAATARDQQPARAAAEPRIYFAVPRTATPAPETARQARRSTGAQPDALSVTLPRERSVSFSPAVPDALPAIESRLTDLVSAHELRAITAFTESEGVSPPLGSGGSERVLSRDQVDVPAALLPGQKQPDYPEPLIRARVTGRVKVRFVVGANGRARDRLDIVYASDSLFAPAVRRFLSRARYRPARAGDRPVDQLVEQDFVFELSP